MSSTDGNNNKSAESTSSKSIFSKLDASESAKEENFGVTEIESICMTCFKNGVTKLMLTRIPFYRDVVISSFSCENCGFQNNSVESANKIQDKGVRIKLLVKDETDLNREMVKSDFATFRIPIIDFEIPPLTQKGFLTTIEGMIDRIKTNLESDIKLRKDVDKETSDKLQEFVDKLDDLKKFKLGEFEIILDDPSGDSFIENPKAPQKDEKLTVNLYKRNAEQSELLGLTADTDVAEQVVEDEEVDLRNEVVQFHNNCPNCNAICETNMKITDIPFFKSVIIMCTICETCGVKSSEVKPGSGIEEKGIKYTLKLTDPSDLNRDLLKSDHAVFEIPEIEFSMSEGTLGSKFTTIEGLLKDCREQLDEISPFSAGGDSEDRKNASHMKVVLDKLEKIKNGEMLDVTIILDDPSGNSYLQNVYAPEDDPNMIVEHYERSYEQNELLGLNDMNTENYQEDKKEKEDDDDDDVVVEKN